MQDAGEAGVPAERRVREKPVLRNGTAAFARAPSPVVHQHDPRRKPAGVCSGVITAARRGRRRDAPIARRAVRITRTRVIRITGANPSGRTRLELAAG